jgi:hypothetical protein
MTQTAEMTASPTASRHPHGTQSQDAVVTASPALERGGTHSALFGSGGGNHCVPEAGTQWDAASDSPLCASLRPTVSAPMGRTRDAVARAGVRHNPRPSMKGGR